MFCQLPTGQSAVPHGLFEGACLVLTLQSNAYRGIHLSFSLSHASFQVNAVASTFIIFLLLAVDAARDDGFPSVGELRAAFRGDLFLS